MRMYDIIAKKRDGSTLSREEIAYFVEGYVKETIPDYQASALLMAIYCNGMTDYETACLTDEMAHSGHMIDLSRIEGTTVDKHSTGGVGDKTTLICGPIAASCGVKVAKMSGRGLGHTGGTIDKMESIPGLQINIDREEFFDIVSQVGISVIGQSEDLVLADKKLYALRDVTATVSSIPLIASSIMSKKIAMGSDCILLDVKIGSGAFMKTLDDGIALASAMVAIGDQVGRRTVALVTDMDRPLGRAIGNSLEIQEVCKTLRGEGPDDLTEISVLLAADMMYLAGKGSVKECQRKAREQIENGQAFEKLKEMVAAQGGDVSVLENPSLFAKAACQMEIKAKEDGYLSHIDTEKCGIASVELGAGREVKGAPIDYAAGIILQKTLGDSVQKGDVLATFFSSSEEKCHQAEKTFEQAVSIRPQRGTDRPLVYARVEASGVTRFD